MVAWAAQLVGTGIFGRFEPGGAAAIVATITRLLSLGTARFITSSIGLGEVESVATFVRGSHFNANIYIEI